MIYKIIAIPTFTKQLKKLRKKYPSIKSDFSKFIDGLQEKPTQGTPLGNHNY